MLTDLPKAALNASVKHGKPYLITNELGDIRALVEAIANHGENSDQATEVIQKVQREMATYWAEGLERKYKGNIEKYYANRSIIRTVKGEYIKYAGRNYRNFTESSQRAGHIALGEFYLAKYFLNGSFYYFLPRLTPQEIRDLDQRNAKEWKLMRADEVGKIVTIEDFVGVDRKWKRSLRSLKEHPLGGSAEGGKNYSSYYRLMENFKEALQQGKIYLKG